MRLRWLLSHRRRAGEIERKHRASACTSLLNPHGLAYTADRECEDPGADVFFAKSRRRLRRLRFMPARRRDASGVSLVQTATAGQGTFSAGKNLLCPGILRIAYKLLVNNKWKFAALLMGLTFSVFLMIQMTSLFSGMLKKASATVTNTGARSGSWTAP